MFTIPYTLLPPTFAGWTYLATCIAVDRTGAPETINEVFIYRNNVTGETASVPGPCFELVIDDDGEPHRGSRL